MYIYLWTKNQVQPGLLARAMRGWFLGRSHAGAQTGPPPAPDPARGEGRFTTRDFCRQKHRQKNADPKIEPGGWENRPGAQGKHSKNAKTDIN